MINEVKLLTKKLDIDKHMLLYGLIGVSGVILDTFLFLALHNIFKFPTISANIVSVSIAITQNFVLNILFNFKGRDHFFPRLIAFYLVGISGMFLSTITIEFLYPNILKNLFLVKIIAVMGSIFIQYILNRYLTFGFKYKKIKA